jgi:nitroreductase
MLEGALTRRTAEGLIEAAILAPSMHNSQPWRFVARLADRVIEIYADPARTLRRGDPRGRAVHIACGSALFNLRLAIAQAGCEPVARLLPSARNPLLLASVRLAGPYRPRPAERDLYAAIRRHADRGPLARQPLPRGLLAAMAEAAALEGASLRLLDQMDALRILRRSAAADPDLRTDPGYLAELAAWTGGLRNGQQGRGHAKSPIPVPGHITGGVLTVRDFSPRPDSRQLPQPVFGAGPRLAVISTGVDDRASWLRAGQATQRVLLLAAHRGLQAAPLSPALELPDAPTHGEPSLDGEHPAMILRLGFGRQWPASGRRPVAQVLRVIPAVSMPQAAGLGRDKSPGEGPPPALARDDLQLMSSK